MRSTILSVFVGLTLIGQTAAASVWEADPRSATITLRTQVHGIEIQTAFESVRAAVAFDDVTGAPVSVVFIIHTDQVNPLADPFDEIIRSPQLLDVESHQRITFQSTKVRPMLKGDQQHFIVTGDLNLRGVTQPIALEISVSESNALRPGPLWRGITAFASIQLADFGMKDVEGLTTDVFRLEFNIDLAPKRTYQARGASTWQRRAP